MGGSAHLQDTGEPCCTLKEIEARAMWWLAPAEPTLLAVAWPAHDPWLIRPTSQSLMTAEGTQTTAAAVPHCRGAVYTASIKAPYDQPAHSTRHNFATGAVSDCTCIAPHFIGGSSAWHSLTFLGSCVSKSPFW